VIYGNKQLENANAVTYTSPSLNGFTLQAQAIYGTKETVTSGTATSAGDGSAWSINYANGPLTAGVAAGSNQKTASDFSGLSLTGPQTYTTSTYAKTFGANAASVGDTVTTQVAAITYDLGLTKLSYLSTNASLNDDSVTVNTFGLSVPLGAFNIGYTASSGTTKSKNSSDVSSNGQQLGVYYSFSKATTAYLSYNFAKDTNGGDNTTTSTAVGLRYAF
jgi:predicted porin